MFRNVKRNARTPESEKKEMQRTIQRREETTKWRTNEKKLRKKTVCLGTLGSQSEKTQKPSAKERQDIA